MKLKFKKIIEFGTDGIPLSEQRIVRLINTICLITCSVTVVTTFLMQLIGGFNWIMLLNGVYSAVCFFLPIYLNYRGKTVWAKWGLILIFNQIILTIFNSIPYEVSSWIVFIAFFPLYVALFSKMKTVIFISLLTVLFICTYIYLQSLPSHKAITSYSADQILFKQLIFFLTATFGVLFLSIFIRHNLIEHKNRLEESLSEKEILIKEVHHRVKNNLQIISSLLNIQSRLIEKNLVSAQDVVSATQSRIQSMALVHEQLYNSVNLKTVSFYSYLTTLCNHLKNIYYPASKNINVKIVGDDTFLDLDKVIALGLIVNEIITNSYKYGFVDIKSPEIQILFSENKDLFTLEIKDNGIGYVPELPAEKKGIGLQLIADLTGQLKGSHVVKTVGGVQHKISFNI
jgi:two-component sensor histidine kinase